jgi:hypothetical protein
MAPNWRDGFDQAFDRHSILLWREMDSCLDEAGLRILMRYQITA